MACTGHWISQALQKMQSFSLAGSAFHVANGAFPLSLLSAPISSSLQRTLAVAFQEFRTVESCRGTKLFLDQEKSVVLCCSFSPGGGSGLDLTCCQCN